jgi:excisionase family DNA binding protein
VNESTVEIGAEFLTVPEVAAIFQVSRQRCYQLVADGVIPSVRFSERRIRVPRRAWEAYLAAQERQAVENLREPRP